MSDSAPQQPFSSSQEPQDFIEKPKRGLNAPTPAMRRGRNRLACFFLAMLTVIPLLCCCFFLMMVTLVANTTDNSERNRVTRQETYQVAQDSRGQGDPLTIEIENQVGVIAVYGEERDDILIEAEFTSGGPTVAVSQRNVEAMRVTTTPTEQGYRIEARHQASGQPLSNAAINLEIRIPQNANLQIVNEVGAIRVEDVMIPARLEITNDVGDLDFEGELAPGGNYSLITNVGDIEVDLDDPDGLQVEASSNTGEVNVDLDLRGRGEQADEVGGRITGAIGEGDPTGTLQVRTEVGNVALGD
jgi:hypothetical protein